MTPKTFAKYFPGAEKGDEVLFERQPNGVALRTKGQSLELRSAIWKEDESDSPDRWIAKAQDRWEGTVVRSSADRSQLTVRKLGSNVEKTVAYDSSTRWVSQVHGSKMASQADASEVKDGDRVIVLGTWGKDGVLHATSVSKRLSHE